MNILIFFKKIRMIKYLGTLVLLSISLISLSTCSGTGSHQIDLMPAPDIYAESTVNPFTDNNPIEKIPYKGILYATDRKPSEDESEETFYLNERGHLLRLGFGEIALGNGNITWEEARNISLLKNRTEKYPLYITAIEEVGILDRSFSVFTASEHMSNDPHRPAEDYALLINKKLAVSERKDIFIYVHGYKVVFENPLLVATELWHFLGYEGVFIAYAWPSIPSLLAYASDLETAAHSSRNLRLFIEYLAKETNVEQIHIIGYSAGTRLVLSALEQLVLINMDDVEQDIQQVLPLGNVILVGSDFDKDIFGGYLEDGLLKATRNLTVYVSEKDKALGFSKFLFRRERLGQSILGGQLRPKVKGYLSSNQDINIIDVTNAAYATSGNGHAYFRKSPWVSSDILMTLMYDLPPGERGLVQDKDLPIWIFPADYIQRLRSRLSDLSPVIP